MYNGTKANLKSRWPEKNYQDLELNTIGGDVLAICLHGIFWSIVLFIIESGGLRWISCSCFNGRKAPIKNDLVLDDDVLAEEKRISSTPKD